MRTTSTLILTFAFFFTLVFMATAQASKKDVSFDRYDCGTQALAYLLERADYPMEAEKVRMLQPQSELGHSVTDLLELAPSLQLTARHLTINELKEIQLPAIVHLQRDTKGHFSVLTAITKDQYILHDPKKDTHYRVSSHELLQKWSGVTLFKTSGNKVPGLALSATEQQTLHGGDDEVSLWDALKNLFGSSCKGGKGGAPFWEVNPININLYVADTPISYTPILGPKVSLLLEFNSIARATGKEIFGKKWTFKYNSYLTVYKKKGDVTLTMPDKNEKLFETEKNGGYKAPYKTFEELVKIADNHYELRFQSGLTYVYSTLLPESEKILLTHIRDSYGHSLTFAFKEGRITTITDALSKVTTFHYNGENRVEQVVGPFGRSAHFEYNTNGNLIKLTDTAGYWTNVEYDSNDNLAAIVNAGNRTEFYVEPAKGSGTSVPYPPPGERMSASRRVTITHANGGKEEFYYNGIAGYGWRVLPEDYVEYTLEHNNSSSDVAKTLFYYADTARGKRAEIASSSYPNGEAKFFTYDYETGLGTSYSDALGNTTSFEYNDKGNVISVTNPKGMVTKVVYEENGIDINELDLGLGSIFLEYDQHHKITAVTNLAGNTTKITYNDSGQIETITDPENTLTRFFYNSGHALEKIERNGLVISETSFDEFGRLASTRDATGLLLKYGYDNLDHLTSITYPDGKKDIQEYGSEQCPQSISKSMSRSGLTNSYLYTGTKKLEKSINNEGGVVENSYDLNGNLTQFTDPNGNSTTYSYDVNNKLLAKIYDDGKGIHFTRDSSGRIIQRTNGRNITSNYYYDETANLIRVEHDDDKTANISLEYDEYNRATSITDGTGTTTFSYDKGSRLKTINGPWENDTLTYDYDSLDRVVTIQVEGGLLRTYSYDKMGRLAQVKVGENVYSYAFKGPVNPLIDTLTHPNGAVSQYQYTNLNQLQKVLNKKSDGKLLNSYAYTYNEQDQRNSETIEGGLPLPSMANGNIDSEFNNLNQLLSNKNLDLAYTYDDDGNMATGFTREGFAFTARYSADNRLTDITYTDDSGINHHTEYIYRWDGFLSIIRKYENTSLVDETRIVRQGLLAIQDRDKSNKLIREYTWGANLGGGIGGLLSLHQEEKTYSYLYDGKGNVVSVLDSQQTPVAEYRYNSFGKMITSSGELQQPFTFSTKRFDSQTGLNYYGYRFYNPSIERWMNRDPIGEEGGINLYGFVENNPVNWVDPHGDIAFIPIIAIGIIGGTGNMAYLYFSSGGTASAGAYVESFFDGAVLGVVTGALTALIPGMGALAGTTAMTGGQAFMSYSLSALVGGTAGALLHVGKSVLSDLKNALQGMFRGAFCN